MSVTTGLQLPFGIQPVNPVPVDSWSGPFSGASESDAINAANAAIPSAIRYQSMEVRLIVGGVSRKYWYRDGVSDSDLVEFASGGGAATTPAGSSGQVQFNDGGSFGASSSLTYDKSNGSLSANILSGSLITLSDGSPYLVAGSNVIISLNPNGSLTIGASLAPGLGTGPTTTVTSWMESVAGDVDGINMVYTLNNEPSPSNALMLYVNGVLQKQGLGYDYYLSGSTVGMFYAPQPGSYLLATYMYNVSSFPGTSTSWMEVPTGEADGVNKNFVFAHTPNPPESFMFYYNGVLQRQGLGYDYLLIGNTVVMNNTPITGSVMTATYPY